MVEQDIAKGIAILVVVQVHTLQLTSVVGTLVGVLFGYAMPFFLFMTGYNYRNTGVSPWNLMRRRLWQLLKTILVYSFGIFILMGAYFLIRGEATAAELCRSYTGFLLSKWGAELIGWDLPKVLFQRLLGPYWFLQFLTTASVVFYLAVDRALRSVKHLLSVLALLVAASMILIELNVVLPWGIQNAPAVAAVMILAAWLRRHGELFSPPSKRRWTWINSIVCLLIIGLIELRYHGAGYMGAGALGAAAGGVEVFLLLAISVLGTYFLVNLSMLIEKVPVLSAILAWLGRHTLQILVLHMTVMHVIRDLLRLPQTNPTELFVERIPPENALVFFLTLVVVSALILLCDRLKGRMARKKAA